MNSHQSFGGGQKGISLPVSFGLLLVMALTLICLRPAHAQTNLPILAPTPDQAAPLVADDAAPPIDGTTLKQIIVEGAQRIEPASVVSHLGLRAGDIINQDIVNEALKRLFSTGLFADASLELRNDSLIVKVKENPIINRIAFEGNDELKDEILQSEVQLRPRIVYTRARVQSDVQRLQDLYRRMGYFAARVVPKMIELEQNRIDLVFEIEEKDKTGIRKVSFIGNRHFSDAALEGEINTKESRWYVFFSDGDTYDPDKLAFDKELLRRFYLKNGYVDFRVISAVAELDDERENFYITFTIDEGERYKIGNVDVTSRVEELPATDFTDIIELETGDWYDADEVSDNSDVLADTAAAKGYAFVTVRPKITRHPDEQTVDITLEIQEAPKVYVERIEVRGNVRTLDQVIRRELELVEGDAFQTAKLNESRRDVNGLGYFKTVDVSNVPGTTADKTIIYVDVEEQSTGELSFGAGYSSTDGALAQIQVRERNLMGRGQDLRLALGVSQRTQNIDLSFTEPYFMGEDLSAGFDVFHSATDNQDESSYDSQRSGFGLRLGYYLAEDLRHSVRYKLSNERVEGVDEDDGASEFIVDDAGDFLLSTFGQSLTYDKRDSRIEPTEGGVVSLGVDYTGLGGDLEYLTNKINAAYYISPIDQLVFKASTSLSMINNFGDKLRVDDRLFLGGDSLRGFTAAGVGPRDLLTDDALGGEKLATVTLEANFPIGLPEEYGIKGSVFSDAGTLYDLEDKGDNVADENSIRVGAGVGISWRSPFGPIRIEFAEALVKEKYDNTESFRINFGTRF